MWIKGLGESKLAFLKFNLGLLFISSVLLARDTRHPPPEIVEKSGSIQDQVHWRRGTPCSSLVEIDDSSLSIISRS